MSTVTQQESINVLIQVALLAQSKGLLTLDEAVIVAKAVEELNKKEVGEMTVKDKT